MRIEHVAIEEITPFDRDPRKNDDAVDAVARSIEAFGFNCPIIVGPDNRICAGHTRWKAAKKLGLETVPVVKVDGLTGEKFLAFKIADNQTARLAQWQDDLLAELLKILSSSTINMDSLGFSKDELDARLSESAEINWDTEDAEQAKEVASRWAVIPLKFPANMKSLVREAFAAKAMHYGVRAKDPAIASGAVVKILLGMGE
jgi:site-specific DNA-methyltransferase (adenine-specific)